MPEFIIKYKNNVVDREIVDDCPTVEAFINRKFGSVDPATIGATVEIQAEQQLDEEDEDPPVEPPKTTKGKK